MRQIVMLAVCVAALGGSHIPLPAQETAPPAQSRFEEWRRTRNAEPITAVLSFGRTVPDSDVRQFLQRTGMRPTAIYMASSGMHGVHRVAPARASAAAVPEARQVSMQMARAAQRTNRARAERHLARADSVRAGGRRRGDFDARALAARFEQDEAHERNVNGGAAIIYAVEVVGSVDQVEAAARDPLVTAAQPAYMTGGRVAVPRPAIPQALQTRPAAHGATIPDATAATARIRRAAGQNP